MPKKTLNRIPYKVSFLMRSSLINRLLIKVITTTWKGLDCLIISKDIPNRFKFVVSCLSSFDPVFLSIIYLFGRSDTSLWKGNRYFHIRTTKFSTEMKRLSPQFFLFYEEIHGLRSCSSHHSSFGGHIMAHVTSDFELTNWWRKNPSCSHC